ncbi:hypothetical protein OG500_01200 [Kitasatospora sp. NBC_01250]|uniref:hypothetical protein n=1 Tax=Kitasatospora sp. NBC_01250 TaxID=2903571 RepID=UPI002E34D750|nr:hypothetical protein [Kitasatospora sp. NBC_01250]
MRKLVFLGLAAVALFGVTAGAQGGTVTASHAHTVLADTGWGHPCTRSGSPEISCGGPRVNH